MPKVDPARAGMTTTPGFTRRRQRNEPVIVIPMEMGIQVIKYVLTSHLKCYPREPGLQDRLLATAFNHTAHQRHQYNRQTFPESVRC
jgi:hypothetical protein